MSYIRKNWREYIYEEIQEDRETYYVEYHPINLKSYYFAHLNLVFINIPKTTEEIIDIKEKELTEWLKRFPLPIMVTSFDRKGDKISINDNKVFMGYINNEKGTIVKKWGSISVEEIPEEQLSDQFIKKVYGDLPFIHRKEKEQSSEMKASEMKKIKNLVDFTFYTWLFLSIIIAFIGWQSYWVGALAFGYSVYKTLDRALKVLGVKNKRQIEKDEKERKMRHYYHHCERNPLGFAKLRAENFEKDEEQQIHKTKERLNSINFKKEPTTFDR
ncbi:hypothetical protein SAMN05216389_10795 [Oceanobacillus limi]|uniref:Uncharacterized protein n=1 Tax=Oceanobacillus limi TaxID=930131 RepID=A0A1I0CUT7_9BACI|nr:hypothetical protein [Oceanobacillus limi]SET23586.1 hypothetical protein SAMN05216389_10795 [Oceanobacillus limi]